MPNQDAAAWYPAADAGGTDAMKNLGFLLADQLDPPDLDGARTWYTRAGHVGNTDAVNNLGDRLDPPDRRSARTWYSKAADAGSNP